MDIIDIYSALDDNKMEWCQQKYPQESATMATLSERLRAEERIQAASRREIEGWLERVLTAESVDVVFGD